ncbi:MAG: cytochrome c [Bacteroidota bacterium]
MKKVLKYGAYTVGGILLLVGLFALFVSFKSMPTYESVAIPELSVEIDSASIAHGKKIASVACIHCHQGESGLQGRFFEDTPLGAVYTANITQDQAYGIGAYTDGELARLLRTGVKKDGSLCLPMMVKFPHMADEDIKGIIAWLRSDMPEVQAVNEPIPTFEPTFLGKALFNFAFKPTTPEPEVPMMDNPLEYGRYLVNNRYMCFVCHSATHEINAQEPLASEGYLKGGTPFLEPGETEAVLSLDISKTAIEKYSAEEFYTMMTRKQRPDKSILRMPMPQYSALDSVEIASMYVYLQSID